MHAKLCGCYGLHRGRHSRQIGSNDSLPGQSGGEQGKSEKDFQAKEFQVDHRSMVAARSKANKMYDALLDGTGRPAPGLAITETGLS